MPRQKPSMDLPKMKSFLIVDDDPTDTMLIKAFLRPLDVIIDSASCSLEANVLLSQKQYDTILVDIRLGPEDGVEVANELDKYKIPIYLMSNYTNGDISHLEIIRHCNCINGFISKVDLENNLRKAFGAKG